MDQRAVAWTVEPIGELGNLEREWRRLEIEAAPSFFMSWDWVGTLLESLPPHLGRHLLRGTAGEQTVALAVLGQADLRRHRVIRARRWILNATGDPAHDRIHIEHNSLLAAPHIGWESLLDVFAAAQRIDELSLPGVAAPPSESVIEERGLLRVEAHEPTFAVKLDALSVSSGDVAAILSSNARSQLRRAMRRSAPVRLEAATSKGEALALFRILKDHHVSWWEERGLSHAFVHPFFERYHERLIERGFAEGTVELLRVCSGDRTLGVLYNFRRGARVYAYQSGFARPQPHERPGVIAHALAIQRAWEQGAEVYDFMAGENQLKRSFANHTETFSWTVIQKPRLRLRAERLARRLKAGYVSRRNRDGGEQD